MSREHPIPATVTPIGTGYTTPPVRRPGRPTKLPPGVIDFRIAKIPHQRARMTKLIEDAIEVERERQQAVQEEREATKYQNLLNYLVDTRLEQINRIHASDRNYVNRMSIDRWTQIYVEAFECRPRQLSRGLSEETKQELLAALARAKEKAKLEQETGGAA